MSGHLDSFVAAARDDGEIVVQPRMGFADAAAMREGLAAVAGLDVRAAGTVTLDSYTRAGDYATPLRLLAAGDPLNGYPILSHPVPVTRAVLDGLHGATFPVQVRHGTSRPLRVFERLIELGLDATEGGPVSYCMPYSRVPLATAVSEWGASCRLLAQETSDGHVESFGGCLLGQLCPPSLLVAMTVLEGRFFVQHGLHRLSLSYAQGTHGAQDRGALRALRALAAEHLGGARWHVVFYTYMGVFPQTPRGATALLRDSARIARDARCERLLVKTVVESRQIPSIADNLTALRIAAAASRGEPAAPTAHEDAYFEEVLSEARLLVDTVLNLDPDVGAAIVKAFARGLLDIPYCLHPDNPGETIGAIDDRGALVWHDAGRLPVTGSAGRGAGARVSYADLRRWLRHVADRYDAGADGVGDGCGGRGRGHRRPGTPMRARPVRRPLLVLVDAFSTGAMLAREAASRYRLVHIRSRPRMPAAFARTVPAELFEEDLGCGSDLDAVLRRLTSLQPAAVLAASEFGVELADAAAAALGLRGNDPARSASRRDKAEMMRALAAAGVRHPRQRRVTDVAELVRWLREHGSGLAVVKPLDSAGSEAVHICRTEQDAIAAFHAIIGRTNLMMRRNLAVLVQEFLEGREYVVNSVSRDGRHWITDAWASHKRLSAGGRLVYDHEDLVSAGDDPALPGILDYVESALDALGIRNGAAHSELVLTGDGPCLLETGARISGLANPSVLRRCTGADQVSLCIDAFAAVPSRLAVTPARYRRTARARCVNLVAGRALPFPGQALRDALAGLPAFDSFRPRVADGQPTSVTVDLNSSPGAVFLVHDDQAAIDTACEVLRDLELELL